MPIDLDVSHFQDAVFWLLLLVFVLFCFSRMLDCAYCCMRLPFSGCWAVPIGSDVSYFQDVGLCLLVQMFLIFRMLGCAY